MLACWDIFDQGERGAKLKKIISAVAFATVAASSWAQVPELGDVLGDLSSAELQDFNDSLVSEDSIMLDDFEGTLNVAVVNQAFESGLISADEASDVEAALEILEANTQFFDFDLLGLIDELLAEGVVTTEELYTTLDLFNQLSVADKTEVGKESFDPVTISIPSDPTLLLDRSQYTATLKAASDLNMTQDGLTLITSGGAFAMSTYDDELDAIHEENVTQAWTDCGGSSCTDTDINTAYGNL